MSKIDLKGMPFYLKDDQIKWVEGTKAKMSIEEKIGQLFFPIGFSTKKQELKDTITKIQPGGMMYRTTSVKKLSAVYKVLQGNSKIPMLLAANLEAGGNGLIEEGTYYGDNMLVAASNDTESAYRLGLICGREAASVGANMAFAPVIDLNFNHRNPITNTRSFGDDPDKVATMGAAYIKGTLEEGISVTIKHFPGDGTDGRDQHLVTTHNSLGYDDWMATFGKAYKTCIQAGARGLMVGHIGFPKYFEDVVKDRPELKEMPATLNPVLLNKLLREELGYNGLTMTDASIMAGFSEKGRRKDLVPQAIAVGCDMFLFNKNLDEDYGYMMEGYRNGILTEERLDEALTRILAIKASLNLHTKSLAELAPNSFEKVNHAEHKQWAAELADNAVTLVKDDQQILPLDPNKYKKIGVMYSGVSGDIMDMMNEVKGFKGMMMRAVMSIMSGGKKKLKPYEKLIEKLNSRGFEAFYYTFGDILSLMKSMNQTLNEWVSNFDAIIYLVNYKPASNNTSLQVQYKAMGMDAPWFIHEVPTILVSLSNPYHGYDLPMVKTFINGYSPTDEVYEAIVQKMVGESDFKGISPVNLEIKEFTGKLN